MAITAEEKPSLKSLAGYVKSNAARVRKAQQMHHKQSAITREADYKGHHIVVRTTYEVEVDGKLLMGHMGVTDSGSVHYHPIPNLSFASALDMVRKIIDVFPGDFGGGPQPEPMPMDHNSHPRGLARKEKRNVDRPAKQKRKGRV